MSDPLSQWHILYIQAIKAGVDHEQALLGAGETQDAFNESLKNHGFSTALRIAKGGASTTVLTAGELLRLLRAQVPEDLIAGYFALTVDELLEKVRQSPELVNIWNTGAKRGKAEVMMVQHTLAVTGDTDMVKFWGKEHLGQDKAKRVEVVDITQIEAYRAAIRDKLEGQDPDRFKKLESKYKQGKIIDLDVVEESETE